MTGEDQDPCHCSPTTDCPITPAEVWDYCINGYTESEDFTYPNLYPYTHINPLAIGQVERNLVTKSSQGPTTELYLFCTKTEIVETRFNRGVIPNKCDVYFKVKGFDDYVKCDGSLNLVDNVLEGNVTLLGFSFTLRLSYVNSTAGFTIPGTEWPPPYKFASQSALYANEPNYNRARRRTQVMNKGGLWVGSRYYPVTNLGYFFPSTNYRNFPATGFVSVIIPRGYLFNETRNARSIWNLNLAPNTDGTITHPGGGEFGASTATISNIQVPGYSYYGVTSRTGLVGLGPSSTNDLGAVLFVYHPELKEQPKVGTFNPGTEVTVSSGFVANGAENYPWHAPTWVNGETMGWGAVGIPDPFYKSPIWKINFKKLIFTLSIQSFTSTYSVRANGRGLITRAADPPKIITIDLSKSFNALPYPTGLVAPGGVGVPTPNNGYHPSFSGDKFFEKYRADGSNLVYAKLGVRYFNSSYPSNATIDFGGFLGADRTNTLLDVILKDGNRFLRTRTYTEKVGIAFKMKTFVPLAGVSDLLKTPSLELSFPQPIAGDYNPLFFDAYDNFSTVPGIYAAVNTDDSESFVDTPIAPRPIDAKFIIHGVEVSAFQYQDFLQKPYYSVTKLDFDTTVQFSGGWQ